MQIHILDGRNGKPLRARQLLVRLDHVDTTASGIVDLQVDPNESLQIVDLYSLYRCEVSNQSSPYLTYSMGKVLEMGFVSPNHCGNQQRKPTPGVLVIYMRPRHFWESMRDFGTLMKDATIH